MRPSDKAVRKASRERLLADFARAARIVVDLRAGHVRWREDIRTAPDAAIFLAGRETSRTRYACLMTAFGQ